MAGFSTIFDKYVYLCVFLIAFLPGYIPGGNNIITKNLIFAAVVLVVSFINLYLNCPKLKNNNVNPVTDKDVWTYFLKTLPIPIIVNAVVIFLITLPFVRMIPIVGQILMIMNTLGITQLLITFIIFFSTLVAQKVRYC